MSYKPFAVAILSVFIGVACSREQPSAMPANTASRPATAPAAEAPAPEPDATPVAGQFPVTQPIPPPPLDEQLAPFAATGYPVCDDFFEKARQCINTRLSPDERKVHGTELRNSVRLVGASTQGDVRPERIEQTCKRLRALSVRKLSKNGCSDL